MHEGHVKKDQRSPAKVAKPVLLMVSQSCKEPEVPAEVVPNTKLAPWLPTPAVSCHDQDQ